MRSSKPTFPWGPGASSASAGGQKPGHDLKDPGHRSLAPECLFPSTAEFLVFKAQRRQHLLRAASLSSGPKPAPSTFCISVITFTVVMGPGPSDRVGREQGRTQEAGMYFLIEWMSTYLPSDILTYCVSLGRSLRLGGVVSSSCKMKMPMSAPWRQGK